MVNGAASDIPTSGSSRPLNLPDRIRRQDPAAPALLGPAGALSYGELNRQADGLAQRLRLALAGDPSRPVAVCLERGPELVVSLLAVLRAGRPYLALEPRQPMELRRSLATSAGAALLLAGDGAGWNLPVLGPEPGAKAEPLDPALAPEAPACLLHTSGSTGTPKRVTLTHGGLAAYPEGFNAGLGMAADDRYLHVASFAYSASVRQLWLPLALGAAVLIAPYDTVLDPLALLELVRREGVTVLDWVPSYLRQVCETLERLPADRRTELLANRVRVQVSSGEPLPWALADRWRSLGYRGRIGNAYGLTETTGLVAWQELPAAGLEAPRDPAERLVPLGRALPQARLQVLDDQRRPVAPGQEGDLWVSGPCLARMAEQTDGHTNEQTNEHINEQTNEHINDQTADHTNEQTDKRAYDTGDRAFIRPDGILVFAGRRDDQIKVHGVRLTLGQVEDALRAHPQVLDAGVVPEADEVSATRLGAVLVARPGEAPEEQELRRFLRERHPEALVPGSIRWASSLPRTLSGKLDRPALAALWLAGPASAAVAGGAGNPATTGGAGDPVADLVQRCWAEALGEDAGDGDFFELGGDSMRVITMLSTISASLEQEIPLVAAFFGDPSLSGLLRVIRDAQGQVRPGV